jgi:propanol-preferring alcohol dehydrogenase
MRGGSFRERSAAGIDLFGGRHGNPPSLRRTIAGVKAMILRAPAAAALHPLELAELEGPAPAPGEIRVRVRACAVCRTDLQICEGDLGMRRSPLVPGHQAVGVVEAVGAGVEGWRQGDRAGVAWLAGTCGTCEYCRGGRENLCEKAEFTGWDRDGGFAEQMTARAGFALRIPDSFDDVAAAPLLCGGVIGYRSLKRSGVRPGQRLGLFGFGASASLAIQVAKHWGCDIYVWTRSEQEQQRALSLGAVWAGGYEAAPGVGLHAAVTFAPSGDVVVAALRALSPGGTVAVNAIHLDRVPEFPYGLLWRERSLCSVANFTRADASEFLELAARLPIRTEVQKFSLDEANEALTALARGRLGGTAVLMV